MADTTLAIASRVQKWDAKFFAEYTRDNRYRPYMGRDPMMPIVLKYELTSGGKQINIPMIGRLRGDGVQDNERLTGNEEALGNSNHPITVRWNRHGVVVPKPEEHWTEMDLRDAVRTQLKVWAADHLRDDITTALFSFAGESFLKAPLAAYYASVSEATKDAWLSANRDRVLFGAAKVNGVSLDHSTALATIDNTDDKLTPAVASLAKEMAKEADPHIRPFRVEEMAGREFYVMFCGTRSFRDLKNNTVMQQANRDARERNVGTNPIFQDGDLIYDGIIFREVPEIPTITNGTIDVQPNFLCGAGALGMAWGQEPKTTARKEDDYGFLAGIGIEECRGVSKLLRDGNNGGSVQNGVVTVYTAGVASA